MGKTGKRIGEWLSDRWPFVAVWKAVVVEDVAGGPSYFYSVGSAVLFVFIVQAVTGIIQLFYYVPTVDHAYDSVSFLRTQVSFGWLIHGLHYWGAQAMVVLAALHLSQVFVWGAHKRPREFTWLLGVSNLLLVLAMSFTGACLPWDVKGYWATEVGTSIAGTVPLIGNFLRNLLRGTETMGQLALDRMFATHILVIPGLLALSVLVHLVAFRRKHAAGPWSEKKRLTTGPFWPDQLLKDTALASIVLIGLVALVVFSPAPVTGPADPADLSVQPKPEWNFLFLYQFIKPFKGALEPVGTVLLPVAAVIFLFIVPFLPWRREERDPLKRPWGMGVFVAAWAAIIALTIGGALSHPGQASAAPPPSSKPAAAAETATKPEQGAKPEAAAKPAEPATGEGKALFASQGCAACHTINGAGGSAGPDLSAEGSGKRSADWVSAQIRDPKSHNPRSIMPSFSTRLSADQIKALTDYLLSLKGGAAAAPAAGAPSKVAEKPAPGPSARPAEAQPASKPESAPAGTTEAESQGETAMPGPAASMIGDASHGAVLYAQTCRRCHGPQGTDKVRNPGSDYGTVPPLNPIDPELKSDDPAAFSAKIDLYIQHGSTPSGPGPAFKMLPFGDSGTLTQQAIANLEAYVLALNHVDRARIMRPGIPPGIFLLATAFVFLVAWWVLWLLLPARRKPRPAPKP